MKKQKGFINVVLGFTLVVCLVVLIGIVVPIVHGYIGSGGCTIDEAIDFLTGEGYLVFADGEFTFVGLDDTPDDYTGHAGEVPIVNEAEDALEFATINGSGSTNFTGLTDTPEDYSGDAYKVVSVNSTEDGLDFISPISLLTNSAYVIGSDAPALIKAAGSIAHLFMGNLVAVAGNTTDNEALVDAAITALPSNGGSLHTVGTLYFSDPISITKKVVFIGDGSTISCWRLTGSATHLATMTARCIFRDMYFSGNSKQGQGLIFDYSSSNSEVMDCNLYAFTTAIRVQCTGGTSTLNGLIHHNILSSNDVSVNLTASSGKWANDWCIFNNRANAVPVFVAIGQDAGNNSGTKIKYNSVDVSTNIGIAIGEKADWAIISENRLEGSAGGTAVQVDGSPEGVWIKDNILYGYTTAISGTIPDSWEIVDNSGYETSNSGTATVLNGTTSIAVTHGLSETPEEAKINLTMLEVPTNAPITVSVANNATATQFWIVASGDPGASNLDVGWSYVR